MSQLGIFDVAAEYAPPVAVSPTVTLRPYQATAVENVLAAFEANRSTLAVMATGTGKTTVFAEVLRRREGRSLVIAHRGELLDQATRRIRQQTGKVVSLEKAEEYASVSADVVVASVQTLQKAARMERFKPDAFSTVIVDEAHHATADSYRKILDYFTGAKILGVTATPDRADEAAMGSVFETVAHLYEIDDAIADGYLCPVRATIVQCDDLDLSDVKTVAGDLNAGELDAVMSTESVLHQVARPTMDLAGGRRTLVFTTSVENAHRMAEVFNRYKAGCAAAVDGGMDQVTRRRTLADHQAGRFQFLINVGVLTEGYDDPAVSCVAMARPTKSRSLYAQMAGRGTRIHPGKDDLLLLDFCGNAGRHPLVSAVDILGGKYPEDVVDKARELVAKEPGKDARAALSEAAEWAEAEQKRKEKEAARRAGAKAKVRYATQTIDPFRVLGVRHDDATAQRFGGAVASEAQLSALAKFNIPVADGMTKGTASKLIDAAIARSRAGLCSFKQAKLLQSKGYDTSTMTFKVAGALIGAIVANNWRPLTPAQRADAVEGLL